MIYMTRSAQFLTVTTATQGILIYEYDSTADQYQLIETLAEPSSTVDQWSRAVISENGSHLYKSSWGTGVLYSV